MKKIYKYYSFVLIFFAILVLIYSFLQKNKLKLEPFVVHPIEAGLGNQLFVIAGQVAYARRFNKEICFEKPFDNFNISYRLCTQPEIEQSLKHQCYFPYYSDQIFKNPECLTFMFSYLQDERFFADQKEYIKEIFQYSTQLPDNLSDIINDIKSKNSVSIHIRRGDYLLYPKIYPIMSIDYYEKGANYIRYKTQKPIHLYVFSDDIKWVKENFRSKYPFTIIEGNKDIIDMQLMSLCHHNIIANSTFSWWGAYLNKNPNKIVIAPDQWNNEDILWGRNIILKDWIILPSEL